MIGTKSLMGCPSLMRWGRVLLEEAWSSIAYSVYPEPHSFLQHHWGDSSIDTWSLRKQNEKAWQPHHCWWFPEPLRVDGNLVWMTVATSFRSLHSHLSFLWFTLWSWSIFFLSEKYQSLSASCYFNLFSKATCIDRTMLSCHAQHKLTSLHHIWPYQISSCTTHQMVHFEILRSFAMVRIIFSKHLVIIYWNFLYKVVCFHGIKKLCMHFALSSSSQLTAFNCFWTLTPKDQVTSRKRAAPVSLCCTFKATIILCLFLCWCLTSVIWKVMWKI